LPDLWIGRSYYVIVGVMLDGVISGYGFGKTGVGIILLVISLSGTVLERRIYPLLYTF
jgi:hypothetical protein